MIGGDAVSRKFTRDVGRCPPLPVNIRFHSKQRSRYARRIAYIDREPNSITIVAAAAALAADRATNREADSSHARSGYFELKEDLVKRDEMKTEKR